MAMRVNCDLFGLVIEAERIRFPPPPPLLP